MGVMNSSTILSLESLLSAIDRISLKYDDGAPIAEVMMPTLPKALYFVFLNHPEGFPLKHHRRLGRPDGKYLIELSSTLSASLSVSTIGINPKSSKSPKTSMF